MKSVISLPTKVGYFLQVKAKRLEDRAEVEIILVISGLSYSLVNLISFPLDTPLELLEELHFDEFNDAMEHENIYFKPEELIDKVNIQVKKKLKQLPIIHNYP